MNKASTGHARLMSKEKGSHMEKGRRKKTHMKNKNHNA
jgi:hypothetical protein